jgi:hypothetical protein
MGRFAEQRVSCVSKSVEQSVKVGIVTTQWNGGFSNFLVKL